ncbi:sensor histidine kinase [Kallotenue papyrolyticum]|uniref:sensor histidine kinase n=1 Tax=Kallotenue papyrolyticum TaxID=1325125 RepID=UPI0004710C52|nr:ATP-binding protein [Kallotenue papyrolyticum]
MSIRLRLTLLYSSILALTLIIFSVTLYMTLERATLGFVQDTLAAEAERLLDRQVITSQFFSFNNREYRIDTITLPNTKFATPETFVQTITPQGRPLYQTYNLMREALELPLSERGRAVIQRGQSWSESIDIQGEQLLVYTRPVLVNDQVIGAVQLARSIEEQDRALDALRQVLIAGSSLATLLAFGVGWVLAGTALRPIDRITQTAHAIGAERDFSRRVNYQGPQDEIGRLATTFNEMLAALQAAYRQEAQALEAQRRFVADASHELRTPLTTIRGNIGLLRRQPPISEADRAAVLADMAEETERMSRLVNDLLMLARADAGRPLRREAVRIRPLIDDLCRNLRLLEPERRIVCDNALELAVLGDPDALKQVLLILVDNALKFTPVTGTIRIATAAREQSVAISVQDTGIGIAPEALPHIFERFYRADSARTGGGSGLGLAIAKTLIEHQGGTISVESAPGRGSTFTVVLPRAAVALPQEAQSAPVA